MFPLEGHGMFVFTCGWPILLMLCGSLPGKVSVCFYVTKKEKERGGGI